MVGNWNRELESGTGIGNWDREVGSGTGIGQPASAGVTNLAEQTFDFTKYLRSFDVKDPNSSPIMDLHRCLRLLPPSPSRRLTRDKNNARSSSERASSFTSRLVDGAVVRPAFNRSNQNSFSRCCICAFRRARIEECIWLTRLSERSSVRPISFMVISS